MRKTKYEILNFSQKFKASNIDFNNIENKLTHGVLYLHAPSPPRITPFEKKKKKSRPDISIRRTHEITPTTILKHDFHKIKHEEVYIRIIILKVNG